MRYKCFTEQCGLETVREVTRPNVCLNCYCGIYFDVVGDEDGNDGDDDNCCVGVV